MRENGVKLISEGTEQIVHPRCVESAEEAGPQDYVLVTLKAHSLPSAAKQMQPLLGPDTAIVSAVNGIPWWYFHGLSGPYEGRIVQSVDPEGQVSALLPPSRAIGCIVYPAAEVTAPGVIDHSYGDRFSLGEPDGSRSPRIEALSQAMMRAGFKSPVSKDIRSEIWVKLWGNLSFNPISALTHATLEDICRYPLARELAATMMREAQAVGEKLGVQFKVTLDQRIAGAEAVGAHKTSMLQDVEHGRALELEALVGSVVELGRITETPTPSICAVYAAASLLNQTLTDARGRLQVQAAG
jgi:2-dehydropantoate 2-reductase